MTDKNKQSFLQGAMILLAANIIVKIIGFIFKIPLRNLIGSEGMGYFNAAYNLYVWFYTISTAGLPVALSRMIAVSNAGGNRREENRVFRVSLIIFVGIGIVGTAVMLLGARAFANGADNPNAYYCIIAIAPTLFFVCITSAYRGFFQGRQNMIPTAVSEILESFGKLVVGIIAGLYAISQNMEPRMVAAYAISGLTVGVAFGSLFLFVTKFFAGKEKFDREINPPSAPVRSDRSIAAEIVRISVPITISASLLSLSGLIDTFVMVRRLQEIGYTYIDAVQAYGDYSTMAISFFNFPNALIVPFSVSIIPVISTAFASGKTGVIRETVESTFRMSSVIAMPSAFGIAAMAGPILSLVFSDTAAAYDTAPLLSTLAISILFVAMVSVTNSMLQAQKQENKTIISMAVGASAKLLSSYILVGIPGIGRFGTPISSGICYFLIMCCNFFFLSKYTDIVPNIRRVFVKPFISASLCAGTAVIVYKILSTIVNFKLASALSIVTAGIVYLVALMLMKTFLKEDILLLPKGERLYSAMKKYGMVR